MHRIIASGIASVHSVLTNQTQSPPPFTPVPSLSSRAAIAHPNPRGASSTGTRASGACIPALFFLKKILWVGGDLGKLHPHSDSILCFLHHRLVSVGKMLRAVISIEISNFLGFPVWQLHG
jgi:hypothetical protein